MPPNISPCNFRRMACLVLTLMAASASAADYYVDDARGEDARAGTTPETAWRTVAKVDATVFAPGDRVLFRRGGSWRDSLRPHSDGTEGNPITFGAYGDPAQPKPIFTGSEELPGAAFHRVGAGPVFTCPHPAPVYAVVVDQQFLFRHDPAGWDRFDADAKPWSFAWKDGELKVKLYDPSVTDAKFTKLREYTYQDPASRGHWRAVVEDDLVCSLERNFTPHHHLVFRDLCTEDSGRLDNNGGYGVRIMGSEDVQVIDVESYRAGKHHFGCINSHRVVFRDCFASQAYPGQAEGSAFVSYSGADSPYPDGASEYWNCTYDRTEDSYSTLYGQWGTSHYEIMEMHGPKVASVLMDGLVSHGGGWTLNNGEHPGGSVRVHGGRLENARLVVIGSGIVVDGLKMVGERATIDIMGSGNRFQNLVLSGTRTSGWDRNTAILSRGPGNVVGFSTIVTAANADGSQSCIASTAAGNAVSCVGDILVSNGPVLDYVDVPAQCDRNCYRAGVAFAAGERKSLDQWRASGFDAASIVAPDLAFVDAAAGDWHLQANSPAVDAVKLSGEQVPTQDADGVARPQGGAVDAGAFERPVGGTATLAPVTEKPAATGGPAHAAGTNPKPRPKPKPR